MHKSDFISLFVCCVISIFTTMLLPFTWQLALILLAFVLLIEAACFAYFMEV